MNKYEEAIDNVARYCSDYRMGIFPPRNELHNELDILNELVKKATPVSPEYEADGYADGVLVYDTWICPNCGTRYEVDYDEFEYCPKCGQCIDWSEDEEVKE